MSAKVWYLAAGQKKVGPLSARRVAKRIESGKVPPGTMAWKEGLESWMPVAEISEFTLEADGSDDPEPPSKEELVEAPVKAKKKSKSKSSIGVIETDVAEAPASKSGVRKRKRGIGAAASPIKTSKKTVTRPPASGAFQALYRVEKADLFRGFGLGLDKQRVLLVLATTGLTAGVVGGLLGVGLLATKASFLLAIPFVLAAVVAGMILGPVSLGALSYHSRHQLAEQAPPTVKESIAWALSRKTALALTPLLLTVAWLVPLIGLALLSVMIKIPAVGPVATGLTFGANILLSALTLFLILTLALTVVFGPIVVAFEETTTVKGTLTVMMDFVKRSTARVVLWSWKPSLAYTPFCLAVLLVAAAILIPPVGLAVALSGIKFGFGGPETSHLIGGALAAIWIGGYVAAALSIPVSVNNSIMSLLYLGGRTGNDDLVTRDAWLAARQEG